MTPKLRIDAYYDIQSALVKALEETNKQNGLLKSCLNCWWFKEKEEICTFKKCNQRPPARVIAYSCGSNWEDKDEIPF